MVLITNPYLEEVNKQVLDEKATLLSVAEERDFSDTNDGYESYEELEDVLEDAVDDVNTTLKQQETDYDGNVVNNIQLLFNLAYVFGKYKEKDISGKRSDPVNMIYDTAYMAAYDEAEKLMWTIQNE